MRIHTSPLVSMSKDNLRIALVSVHGCPLARLGEKDTGGMNVYLLQLAKELGSLGITADVFTRFHDPNDPEIVDLGPGSRVIHIKAGPWYESKEGIYSLLPEFVENMISFQKGARAGLRSVSQPLLVVGGGGVEA